jgi:SAM-dependent methyltransferase
MLETVPCDVCGSDRARLHLCVKDKIYGLPGEFSLVRCEDCGLLYLNPRPDRAAIGQFYPDLDYHAFKPTGGLKQRLLDQRRHSEAKRLLASLPNGATVLEIGCGTGELLAALKDRGAQAVGVEPNGAAAKTAHERYGLMVHTGMLDDWHERLPAASFDLILMKYALEHVHSPKTTLAQIAGLLRPGGRAVFWIPNAASWDAQLFGANWRGLDAPRHLYIFTPKTIRAYAQSANLNVLGISYSGVPNDWAGSVEFALRERSPRLAKLMGMDNPLMMAAWLPISILASKIGRAGRMRVEMGKSTSRR